jgi:hypothetical protein
MFMLVKALRFVAKMRSTDEVMERFRQTILTSMCVVMAAWVFSSMAGVLQLLGLLFGLSVATLMCKQKSARAIKGSDLLPKNWTDQK